MDTNKIEKALLDRELKVISEKLRNIGMELRGVFAKYENIKGQHGKELHAYIVKHVLVVDELYYAGYTTVPGIDSNTSRIPDCLKEIILKWAVDDFFSKFDEIENVINYGPPTE